MPVAEAPDDDEVRQTYNFAPGNIGLVYRAEVPDYGASGRIDDSGQTLEDDTNSREAAPTEAEKVTETTYKLQSMKWGLVPFWTKRNPDYRSVMKTINARDDSLASKGGMWNTMKQRKRCIVVAQGFYEWLKKNGGKEKIPHYVKRKDEQLMCFAGLWDCVRYEGSDENHYTYTIITTDSNKQLSFLHDRMPVILENGSDQIRIWLDPGRSEWSKELQSLLKPFQGELDCYPVTKDVGKVGNSSPAFIVPVASTENKHNIANFFSNTKISAKGDEEKSQIETEEAEFKEDRFDVTHDPEEKRITTQQRSTEDNAPVPIPPSELEKRGVKRGREEDDRVNLPNKSARSRAPAADGPFASKSSVKSPKRKTRSATNNESIKGKNGGSQKITTFYK